MAKMSEYELRKMRGSIIDGAYRKREQELEVRKTAIAKKNRELQLEPIQHLLKQLYQSVLLVLMAITFI